MKKHEDPTMLAHLTPDPVNARKHSPRNLETIERAIKEVGAARSIVIDEDGRILAGNATVEAAGIAGLEKVRVVEADGETIVAVRRRGLTEEQKRRLALYDNRASELADGWDEEVLGQFKEAGLDFDGIFYENELDDLLKSVVAPLSQSGGGEIANGSSPVISYTLIFDSSDQQSRFFAFIRSLKERYPDEETIGARLDAFLSDQEG